MPEILPQNIVVIPVKVKVYLSWLLVIYILV